MDVIEFFGGLALTGFASVSAAQYLSKKLLDHRLSKDLKKFDELISNRLADHKADLDQRVNAAKAEREASLRRDVEVYLGERSAERTYEAEARRRLYQAVGPLRFQLLIAAAELSNRVARIGDGKYEYDMSIRGYFGQSTAYRLLRVLAICELIERQIAIADFAVDPAMRALLKFKMNAFLSLSSHRVSLGHSLEDWSRQAQHVFYDVIAIVASNLIIQDGPGIPSRVIRFDEFVALTKSEELTAKIDPFPRLISNFTPKSKPLFWLRLLALSQLCLGLLDAQGRSLPFEVEDTDLNAMLDRAEDSQIKDGREKYLDALRKFRLSLHGTDAPMAVSDPRQ